ncbi:SCO family protein [Rhizobium subbaraonis]|uniref:SCO family protein n=1 Tax=Rhizobium subbaraonis TaxID=908946 RepID=UPI001FDF9ACC|nr:SCO family protein [Rhizobium subbaraonis]
MFKGNPALVYFGYTHCPEVCPTTLYEVAGYLKELGPEGASLKSYFFSVDRSRQNHVPLEFAYKLSVIVDSGGPCSLPKSLRTGTLLPSASPKHERRAQDSRQTRFFG